MISQLMAVVGDVRNHLDHPVEVRNAIRRLGELRAEEATQVLVEYIAFPYCGYGDVRAPHPMGGGQLGKSMDEVLPAVSALIQIGEPAITPVIKKLVRSNASLEFSACRAVLQKIRNRQAVLSRIRDELTNGPAQQRQVLKEILRTLTD